MRFSFCLLLLVLFPCFAAFPGEQPRFIVTPEWVAERLGGDQLVLLHVGREDEYVDAHLPGARFVDRSAISAPMQEGAVVLEMPAVEQLESAFEALGISDSSLVVVYWGTDWVSPSARVVLTLDYIGLGTRSFLLDGGMPAWVAEGRGTTEEIPEANRGNLTPHQRSDVLVDLRWVQNHLDNPSVQIIDSRDREFYTGQEEGNASRAGHLPGASSIPFHEMLDDALRFKSPEELRKLLHEGGMAPGKTAVSYCHIGQQASVTYLVARILGYEARMYDGSMNEWSRYPELPLLTDSDN